VTHAKPIFDAATRELLDAVTADPFLPLRVAIVAPGGYGKSLILRELSETYRRAGIQVAGMVDVPPDAADAALAERVLADSVLVVDDVHQLGDAQVRQLCAVARSPKSRVILAHRPWPVGPALAELDDLLSRSRPSVRPGRFDRTQIRSFVASATRAAVHPALVEFLYTQAGGVPRYVARLATLVDVPAGAGEQPAIQLPRAAIELFRPDLDALDGDLQRFLFALEAGVGPHTDLLGPLLDRDLSAVDELMAAARATGLVGEDGALLPIGRRAIAALLPSEHRIGVRQRLAELQLERGGPVLGLARSLLGTGIGGTRMATIFQAAAREALAAEPAQAAELFAAAVQAGTPAITVAAGWAHAAALSGDLDTALRLADQVIGAEDSVVRADAAHAAAAALAHRGQLGRSTELFRWSGTGSSGAFAVVGMIGTGHLADADRLAEATHAGGPPTLLSGAAALMAGGVRDSVAGSTTTALSKLVRASALLEPTGRGVLLPDSPAALAALTAMHCGELTIAESVLARAIAAQTGGRLMSVRHRLLQAWICMVRGKTSMAREHLAGAKPGDRSADRNGVRGLESRLEPRDELFAIAIEVGLARRNSDLPALRQTWGHASEAVMRHPVDLFTLLPLGEFAVAAARLRDQSRLAPHLMEANALLHELGDPPLWSTPLHWSGLHAALIAEQHAVAEEHAAALTAHAGHGRYCAVLAAAAECWLAVVTGKVDPAKVESAARGLQAIGLWWDGARLAGQAAIRTPDRKAMVRLLECARLLQGRPARPAASVPGAPAAPGSVAATTRAEPTSATMGTSKLSEREREVASLVLAGLTYKQIGDRLFISAKTVEHHMARMRQRLGATSRSDLLAQLRALTAADHV
jgi:DNA-binding CsgD family transcriptional regulator